MKKMIFFTILLFLFNNIFSQESSDYEIVNEVKATSVKDQGMTGTCWSFATISFLESEFLRTMNKELDLSEMYIVYNTYLTKAEYYIQLHGVGNFSQGGQAHDVINTAAIYGFVPQEVYNGNVNEKNYYDHSKMEGKLKDYLDSIIKINPIPEDWKIGFTKILSKEIGELPENFEYQNEKYEASSFAEDYLKFSENDYIELTSYSHHDYYSQFDLEVPDNWSHDYYYNLPVDELIKTIDYALENGFSICWDGDVSEEKFNHRKGFAELSDDELKLIDELGYQDVRQITFENQTSTDDHLMHLTGKAVDKKGNVYYQIKNSWGDDSNKIGGYLYMSEDFVRIKTIAILVNKEGIPDEIRKELDIK